MYKSPRSFHSSLKSFFASSVLQDSSAVFLSGYRVRAENDHKVLLGDLHEKEIIATYSLEEVTKGVSILGRKVQIQMIEKNGLGYCIKTITNHGDSISKELEYDEQDQMCGKPGLQLIMDVDIPGYAIWIRKRGDSYEFFTKEKKGKEIIRQTSGKIFEIIDNKGFNYLYKKRYGRRYIDYLQQGISYMEKSVHILEDRENSSLHPERFLENKEHNFRNSDILCIDRDAIVFQHIFKRIGSKFGFTQDQFGKLLIPQNIEDAIRSKFRKEYEELFDYSKKINPFTPEVMNAMKVHIGELDEQGLLEGFRKIIDKSVKKDSDSILLFDVGCLGSTIMYCKALCEYLYPEKKIYTSLCAGEPISKAAVDYMYESGGMISCRKIERWPKFDLHLQELKVAKNGTIIEERKRRSVIESGKEYDTVTLTQITLDSNNPLEAKVFGAALNKLITDYMQGTNIFDTFPYKRDIRNKEKMHIAEYGL